MRIRAGRRTVVLLALFLTLSLALSGCASLVLTAVPPAGSGDGAIVQVLGGPGFALALRADGQVICAGSAEAKAFFADWDRVAKLVLRPYSGYVLGLGPDGTILHSAGPLYAEYSDWEEDEDWDEDDWDEDAETASPAVSFVRLPDDDAFWTGLLDVATVYAYGGLYTVGLRADGTAAAVLTYPEEEWDGGEQDDWDPLEGFADQPFTGSFGTFTAEAGTGGDEAGDEYEGDDGMLWDGSYVDVSGWKDVVSLVHNGQELFGLTADGRVLSCFHNDTSGQRLSQESRKSFSRADAQGVRELLPVPNREVLALSGDGSVFVPVWDEVKVPARLIPPKGFAGIASLCCSRAEDYLVCYGLRADGTVAIWDCDYDSDGDTQFPKGKYEGGYSEVSSPVKTWKKMKARIGNWKDVRALYVIPWFDKVAPIAVFADGSSSCEPLLPWTDIESLCGNGDVLIALRRGGTVSQCSDEDGWEAVESWKNIVSLCFSDFPALPGGATLYGLTADGRICAAGDNSGGQCDFPAEYMT